MKESEGFQNGVCHTTTDQTAVHNEEEVLTICTADVSHVRRTTFQVAGVTKPLCSASKMVAKENRVMFAQDGSDIENEWSKVRLLLIWEDTEVFVLEGGMGRGPRRILI